MVVDLFILFLAAAVGAIIAGSICYQLGKRRGHGKSSGKQIRSRSFRTRRGDIITFPQQIPF